MKFIALIKENMVNCNLRASTRDQLLKEILTEINHFKKLKHVQTILDKLLEREKQSSTAVGDCVAIPHARLDTISEPLLFIGVSKKGIDFKSPDKKPVHLFFLFLTPRTETAMHLKILSRISLIVKNKQIVNRLIETRDNRELFRHLLVQRTEKENFISLTPDQIFQELETGAKGLSESTAKSRLLEYGLNELRQTHKSSLLRKFLYNFTNLLALLMWAGAILAFAINLQIIGWSIVAVIIINALFSFWQEFKAEKAIEALKNLIPMTTRVVRNNNKITINSTDVVPGDLVYFDEGDNIPADARLITAHDLKVDNSIFSGESRPGYKSAQMLHHTQEFMWTEMPNLVFAGTSVISGQAFAVIIATGMATEIGKIASLTQSVREELSPLQKEIDKLTKIIALVAIMLGIGFLLLGTVIAHLSLTTSVFFALGIILGNVPEGLLPTVTLSLAAAVQRMSKHNVLVKKLSSVETLGSTNIICTDKTGTITTNQISVRKVWTDDTIIDVTGSSYKPEGAFLSTQNGAPLEQKHLKSPAFQLLAQTSVLCSTANLIKPAEKGDYWDITGDPTEGALLVMAEKAGYSIAHERTTHPLIRRFPFESIRKKMSSIHVSPTGDICAYVKGSPKEILAVCSTVLVDKTRQLLSYAKKEGIVAATDNFAREGLRLLALAYRAILPSEDLTAATARDVESNLTLIGIVAMYDPPRPEVKAAIDTCRKAGIRTIMITGDYDITALSIARQVGIVTSPDARTINGTMLSSMSDSELKNQLENEVVFARVNPEHKYRITNLLREMGNIVAVTGDGVNDAPALKRANIGISMGMRGTNVAKEASTMVLSDDNFASIVAGIEEGRAVFDNIRKFITYIFAHLVPEVIPFVVYAIFATPVPITPLQILAIDLGTETLPALALGMEKPEPGIMEKPPRQKGRGLIDRTVLLRGYGFLGILNALFVMTAYFWTLYRGGWRPGVQLSPNDLTITNPLHLKATTMVFAGIIVMQFANLYTIRSETRSTFELGFFSNKLILWGIGLSIIFTCAIIYLPFLQKIFSTTALSPGDWLMLTGFMLLVFLIEELRKKMVNAFRK